MKYFTFIFILLILCSAASCSRQGDNRETEALRNERDSLLILANVNQRDLERMTSFFDDVAACIDSITEQETLLASEVDIETNRHYSQREISQRLNQLIEIIVGQRERITLLVDSLNNRVDTIRTSGLRSTITYLTNQLAAKEAQISRLQAELSGQQRNIRHLNNRVQDLTSEVSELTSQNEALTEVVQIQTEIINEGYVLVADKQQLKDMGVIQGGGLFRKSKINLGVINTSQCNKVNISTLKEIPIHSSKVQILSHAPAHSYMLQKNGGITTLVITDANAFWSLSNILVIQIQL